MPLLDLGQGREALDSQFQRGPEALCMLLGFLDCSSNSRTRRIVALLLGKVAEARIHFSVLVRLALNGKFEAIGRIEFTFGKQQIHVPEGMLEFLGRGGFEYPGRFLAAMPAAYLGEELVLDMRHRFAGKAASRFWMVTDGESLVFILISLPRIGADVRPKDIVAG